MKDLTIDGLLYALSDPIRREIIAKLASCDSMSCAKSCAVGLSPSTVSFHHRILRENGLIKSEKVGVTVVNTLRKSELDKKFPGLLDSILKHHK